jgi:hypothetical protein
MSITTTPTAAGETKPRIGRLRRFGTAVLMAAAVIGGSVATAAPASAASAVSFCFTFANPPAHSAYANQPVYLNEKLPHGWDLRYSGRTNASGCGTFYNTNTANPLWVRAYTSTAYQTWDGWTPYYANAGAGGVNLGKGMVYRTR